MTGEAARRQGHTILSRRGHYSMQQWSATCSCGWETHQRDWRWRDDAVLKHLATSVSAAGCPYCSVSLEAVCPTHANDEGDR